MAKKKKKQMRETLYCPYCKRPGVLRPAAYVYGDNNLDPEKYLYVCSGYPSCDSYIGAHKKSMRPMGTMADSNLRNKRIEAHRALDAIWKNGYMTKHSTYIWLQNRLNLREKDTHIGMFSVYDPLALTIRDSWSFIGNSGGSYREEQGLSGPKHRKYGNCDGRISESVRQQACFWGMYFQNSWK